MANAISLGRYDSLWSEQDKTLFNQLPIYFAKTQGNFIKYFSRWPKLLKPQKWSANMGTTMRGVRKEKSPILRGQFLPQTMNSLPQKDVIEVREVTEDVQLYRHDFESNLFHFLPSFQDFLTDHVDATNESINEQEMVATDLFYRTAIFHAAPYIWVCGKPSGTELTQVPYWTSPNIALSKDQNTLQQLITDCQGPLNLKTMAKLGTVMFNDIAATPFSGSMLADGTDGKALQFKYAMLMGSEVWDYFPHDPYLHEVKALDLNVVTGPFQGQFWGRWTTLMERFEMRIAADGTIPAPEIVQENPAAYNQGEREMNPTYVNAPFGVAFAVGAEAYKYMQIGPPPKDWNGTTMKEFSRLDWNGRVDITQNVLVPGLTTAGELVEDTNKRGEYLQLIASLAWGIVPIKRRNIVPVIYQRTRVS